MWSRKMRGSIALLFFVVLLSGCPETGTTPTPREERDCERIGDRCHLPDGPIGICNETTGPCNDPPCLACMSQH